jgi:hypothetical protein
MPCMGKYYLFAALAALPLFANAQATIDGVWQTDPKTVTGGSKPSRYVLDDKQYRCESCAPKIKAAPDGKERALTGNPYVQKVAARIVDDRTFEVTAWAGKIVSLGKMTVSADGLSMVREVTIQEANGTTSTSIETLSRVGPLPKRGHLVTGTWKFATLVKMSDETLTFKSAAGTLSMNASDGSGYDAPLDGTRVPMRNSPGIDMVAVTSRDGATFDETSYSGDKPTWVNIFIVAPDGATMKVKWEDKLRGAKGSFTMLRQ